MKLKSRWHEPIVVVAKKKTRKNKEISCHREHAFTRRFRFKFQFRFADFLLHFPRSCDDAVAVISSSHFLFSFFFRVLCKTQRQNNLLHATTSSVIQFHFIFIYFVVSGKGHTTRWWCWIWANSREKNEEEENQPKGGNKRNSTRHRHRPNELLWMGKNANDFIKWHKHSYHMQSINH